MRNRAWRRKKDFSKAKRKKDIDQSTCFEDYTYYNNLHQYSKNKIHCSCWMCSAKIKTHGYNISDQKRIDSINEKIRDNECEQ